MKLQKVEKHHITKSHPMFKICNEYTKKSKNLYNYANYINRQRFVNKEGILSYKDMWKLMKSEEVFKEIGSNSGQHTLKMLDNSWKSFFALIKDYSKNPHKYLGRPSLPSYLDKDKGRYTWVLTNVQSKIVDGYLKFSFKPLHPFNNLIKTNVTDKHLQTRISPRDGYYVLEIVYEIDVKEATELNNKIIGIDLGLNNLMTVQNNLGLKPFIINGLPLKSMNQYYNIKKSKLQSELKKKNGLNWSKQLADLTRKRDNKIENYMHNASKYIVNYCLTRGIDTVVIGKNNTWKQDFKRQSNFTQVPFEKLITQLQYKLLEHGIKVIMTEESYTSKASFLDNDEMKNNVEFSGKRIKRGLYKTNDDTLINADVNGASNIMRKVFPNVFDGIKGVGLHPVIINM